MMFIGVSCLNREGSMNIADLAFKNRSAVSEEAGPSQVTPITYQKGWRCVAGSNNGIRRILEQAEQKGEQRAQFLSTRFFLSF